MFYDVSDGLEQRQGSSYINTREVEVICGIIQKNVQENGRPRQSFSIITFYKAQASALSCRLSDLGLGPPITRVATVDGFQGSEADVYI